ncbi:nucleoside triphosphate pyrophosphohydrolase family protein [Alcanivorax sp. S6407]|uniref:nucleoside triphosphate pyrophosphohydrolase family protein n=1 Tax=Alcanivorax sp. S6407 TaxID=2926424 RepID=UPI001FF5DB7A|nr:nucleoside triphosphate pyrophosphohydrolase family protein [Alcanivorax sp. S6407]MCK0155254.1 nucleoside triphosphate pyrophosphohydrolase family protein [Alcanivorax sp. S6407]
MARSERSNFQRVGEFHRAFSLPVEPLPLVPDDRTVRLRLALLLEEFHELAEATCQSPDVDQQAFLDTLVLARQQLEGLKGFDVDLVEVADALTDINYVTYGAGHTFGIDLDATCEEVHRSNMSKLGADGKPVKDERGKVLKGPDYSPPSLEGVLAAQGSKSRCE